MSMRKQCKALALLNTLYRCATRTVKGPCHRTVSCVQDNRKAQRSAACMSCSPRHAVSVRRVVTAYNVSTTDLNSAHCISSARRSAVRHAASCVTLSDNQCRLVAALHAVCGVSRREILDDGAGARTHLKCSAPHRNAISSYMCLVLPQRRAVRCPQSASEKTSIRQKYARTHLALQILALCRRPSSQTTAPRSLFGSTRSKIS